MYLYSAETLTRRVTNTLTPPFRFSPGTQRSESVRGDPMVLLHQLRYWMPRARRTWMLKVGEVPVQKRWVVKTAKQWCAETCGWLLQAHVMKEL